MNVLSSKADTIKYLINKKLQFKIPNTYIFTIGEWLNCKKKILQNINKNFKKKIIIRSSALGEDKKNKSQAGRYLSVSDIKAKNVKLIIKSIIKVWKSYKSNNPNNKVIVQNQITNVSMSGVLFTHELSTGAPYYVVNYDDKSGKTDTVTSGSSDQSNKKLYILRSKINYLRSKRFKKLIKATVDLEKKINNYYLDIEFAVDKKFNPYLLQVRSITSRNKRNRTTIDLINKNLKKIRVALKNKFKKITNVFGDSTVFGQMPDWNPAEMIGQHPDPLSYSLYEKLITKKSWLHARKLMGYYCPPKNKLMHLFAGKPYIDTRLSFNSFLVKGLSKKNSKKIVNFWIDKLKKNPQFHDKIEFEIAITCFSFDILKKIKKNLPPNINRKSVKNFVEKYKEHTIEIMQDKHEASIERSLEKINILIKKQKNYQIDIHKNIKNIDQIIKDCIKYGVVPFAICARHAFIAQTLLKSLEIEKVISKNECLNFKKNLKTITSEFLQDINSVYENKLSKKDFMNKYGHLRSGTYDIKSKRYDEYKDFLFNKQKIKKTKKCNLLKKKNNINKIIKKNKINFSSEFFIDYIQKAVAAREFSKFIFTKSVSEILSILKLYGKKNNFKLDDLSLLKIDDFKKSIHKQRKIIKKNKLISKVNRCIRLPEVLFELEGTFVIPYQVNNPNYITNKKIKAHLFFLNVNNSFDNNIIKNKIVLIEGADPGYDWIFSMSIKGLITKFGGANSHMAIRCAELNIPAAIGCGEKKFEILKKAKMAELDCSTQKVLIIDR
jgi:hypothetical protein